MCVCGCVGGCVCVCVCVCVGVHARACMHMCTCVNVQVRLCTHVHVNRFLAAPGKHQTVHHHPDSDLHDFCLFIRGKQVGHFSGVEEVVNVFQEGLLLDLRVCDQEHCGLALGTCALQQVLVEYHRQAHVVVH